MHEPGIWFKPDLVARIELMAFAEYRDHLLAAEPRENLGLRAGRLDHDDLGLGAVVGERKMLGPHAIDRGLAVGIGGRVGNRQLYPVRALEEGRAVHLELAVQKVHRRRTDESGDE